MDSIKNTQVRNRTQKILDAVLEKNNIDPDKNLPKVKVDRIKNAPKNITPFDYLGAEFNINKENEIASDPNIILATLEKKNYELLKDDLFEENNIIPVTCGEHGDTINEIDSNENLPVNRSVYARQGSSLCLNSENDGYIREKAIDSNRKCNSIEENEVANILLENSEKKTYTLLKNVDVLCSDLLKENNVITVTCGDHENMREMMPFGEKSIHDPQESNLCLDSKKGYFTKEQATDSSKVIKGSDTSIDCCSTSSQAILKPDNSSCLSNIKNNFTEAHTLSDFSEDDDDSVKDRNYETDCSTTSSSTSTSSSSASSSSSPSSSSTSPPSSNVLLERVEPNKNNEKVLTRKRSCNESEWIRNKTKRLRNAGKEDVSTGKGKKVILAKVVKAPCGEKCKFKCNTKITEGQRQTLFNEFYSLNDINEKREFIVRHSDRIQPKYRRETKRNFNYAYYFTINASKVRVCKKFFKLTLDINDRTIDTAQKKRTSYGTIAQDARGKHGNQTKVDRELKEGVRRHIRSIPRVESHYLRAQTTKEFIDGGKTIADLHRDYQVLCRNEKKPSANYHMYSDIFNREFNISFFVPKKDQCNLCYVYQNANQEEKEKMKTEYEEHQNEKVLSRNEMDIDKKKVNETYTVACFDMQAVVQIPKGEISIFYYKSKLNTMNFTITEMSSDATKCYVWHEAEGGKGATEVGSCMLSYLQEKSIKCDSEDLEIVLYSDNCGAQQKNRFLIAVFMYAVMNFKIKSITHKYLVVGHTQNPGDSAHSTIEKQVKRSLKTSPIFVPDQFVTLIRLAKKKGNPYDVKELTHDDFFDVKQLMADFGSNFTVNSKGKQVFINNLRVVKVEKAHPWKYFYKTSISEIEFEHVAVKDHKAQIKTRKSTRKIDIDSDLTVPKLRKAYPSKLSLNENKKKDLTFLLEKGYIPKYYLPFYNSLF